MNPERKSQIIKGLGHAIAEAEEAVKMVADETPCDRENDCCDISERITTLCRAAIEHASPSFSPYRNQLRAALADSENDSYMRALKILGIAQALKSGLTLGHIESVEELVHADLFSDYLEMAEHLLEEKYKDAAAVIIGSSLEAHLKQLCAKAGVDTEIKCKSSVRPKNAERMNDDLKKAGTHGKLYNKNVTAWLDLRNKAAHGEYDKYLSEQVSAMLSGVRSFITAHPA